MELGRSKFGVCMVTFRVVFLVSIPQHSEGKAGCAAHVGMARRTLFSMYSSLKCTLKDEAYQEEQNSSV